MKVICAWLFICLSYFSQLWGQGFPVPDFSGMTLADSSRVWELNEAFKKEIGANPDKAEALGKEALALAEAIDFRMGVIKMSNNMGVLYINKGDYDGALELFQENLKLVGDDDLKWKANSLVNMGSVYYRKGDFSLALNSFQDALPVYTALNDSAGMMHVYNNMAAVNQDQGIFAEALRAYFTVIRYWAGKGKVEPLAAAHSNVGHLYLRQGDHLEAEKFFLKSRELFISIDDQFGASASMLGLAEVKALAGDHEGCVELLRETLLITESIPDPFGIAECHLSMADNFLKYGNIDSAMAHAVNAKVLSQELGMVQGVALSESIRGRVLVKKGKGNEAIKALKASLEISQKNTYRELSRDSYKALADAYGLEGEHEAAFESHKHFFALHDSLFSEEEKGKVAALKVEYKSEESAQTIDALEIKAAEDESRMVRLTQGMIFFVSSAALLLFLALIFYLRFRNKKRLSQLIQVQKDQSDEQRSRLVAQNKQIRQINANLEKMVEARTQAVLSAKDELDAFLYQSAHALRRPLLRIEGLLSILKPKLDDPADAVLVDKLDHTLYGMDQLLYKLVYINEVQRRDPEMNEFNFSEMLDKSMVRLDAAGIEVAQDFHPEATVVSDELLLQWMFENLIENAILFKRQEVSSFLSIGLDALEMTLVITVTDNGKGIPETEVDKIFDMFHRADVTHNGNGLGLYLVGKIVEKLHGEVKVESIEGEGTQIYIELPRHFI